MDYKVSVDVCQESDTCVPGCRCPDGMLEENGNCVDVKNCFCHDKDGTTVLDNFEAKSEFSCQKWSVIPICFQIYFYPRKIIYRILIIIFPFLQMY